MKMRDVFELPVDYVDFIEMDSARHPDRSECAAHAINQHDALVESLDSALKLLIKAFDAQRSDYDEQSISLSDLGSIHELLTRAKGAE